MSGLAGVGSSTLLPGTESTLQHVENGSACRPSCDIDRRRGRWPTPRQWLLLAVGAACFAIWSLPVIGLAQWFPLDYSLLATVYRDWQEDPWRFLSPYGRSAGRYYPFYWSVFGIQSYLFGTDTWLYAIVLGLVVLATCVVIAGVVGRATRRRDSAWLVIPLLYLGTPVAENISTIGKAEPLMCLLMFAAIAIFERLCGSSARGGRIVLWYAGIGAALTLALWTKETAITLFVFCVAGLAVAIGGWMLAKERVWRDCARDYLRLLQGLVCGTVIAKLPYFLVKATSTESSYTTYALTPNLVWNNLVFYATQQPDVILFGLLGAGLLAVVARMLLRQQGVDRDTAHAFLLFTALAAMGWAYLTALLIWRWPMGYYLLPASFAFRAAAVGGMIQAGSLVGRGWPKRLFLAVVGVTTVYGAPYAWYVIGSQVAYSRMYTAMLEQVCDRVPHQGRLLLESYPVYSEQVGGTHMWLHTLGRRDIRVGGVADYLDPAVPTPEICRLLQVTDDVLKRNREQPPARGDHLVIFTGEKLATWMVRGVAPYVCHQSLLAGVQGDYDLELVAESQISQYAVYPHVWTWLPTSGRTSLGYKLFKVASDKPRYLWYGRYPDGWVGSEAAVTINSPTPTRVMLRVSAPPFTLPNTVTVTCDDGEPIVVPLTNTDEVLVPIDCACASGSSTISIGVARVIAPRDLKINRDKRKLGIRAACEPVRVQPAEGG